MCVCVCVCRPVFLNPPFAFQPPLFARHLPSAPPSPRSPERPFLARVLVSSVCPPPPELLRSESRPKQCFQNCHISKTVHHFRHQTKSPFWGVKVHVPPVFHSTSVPIVSKTIHFWYLRECQFSICKSCFPFIAE